MEALCSHHSAHAQVFAKWMEVVKRIYRENLLLSFLSYESWMIVNKNPDRKKKNRITKRFLITIHDKYFFWITMFGFLYRQHHLNYNMSKYHRFVKVSCRWKLFFHWRETSLLAWLKSSFFDNVGPFFCKLLLLEFPILWRSSISLGEKKTSIS